MRKQDAVVIFRLKAGYVDTRAKLQELQTATQLRRSDIARAAILAVTPEQIERALGINQTAPSE